jgi:hypothetical protein
LISASGYQDHTTSPSTNGAFVAYAFAGHRIPQPNVRDDREASLKRVRDGIGLLLFLPKREGKYFFRQGWTGSISLIRFDFSRGRRSGELPREITLPGASQYHLPRLGRLTGVSDNSAP